MATSILFCTDVFSHAEVADGRIWLKPDGIGCFAGDLPETEQKVVWATQAVPVPDLFTQKVDGVAWRSKPSWCIVGTEDHTVNPELERFAAKRMGASTVELRSSHVPMLSQPNAVHNEAPQTHARVPQTSADVLRKSTRTESWRQADSRGIPLKRRE